MAKHYTPYQNTVIERVNGTLEQELLENTNKVFTKNM